MCNRVRKRPTSRGKKEMGHSQSPESEVPGREAGWGGVFNFDQGKSDIVLRQFYKRVWR